MIHITTYTCQHCGASISEDICPYCGCKVTGYNPSLPIQPRNIKKKTINNTTGYYDYANNIFVIAPSKKLYTLDGCIVVLGAEGVFVYDKNDYTVIKVIEGVNDLYQYDKYQVCAVFKDKTEIYSSFTTSLGLTLIASIPDNGKILWEYKRHYYVIQKGLYDQNGQIVLNGNIQLLDKFDKYIIVKNEDGVGIFDIETDTQIVPMQYPLISYNPQFNRLEVGDKEEEILLINLIGGLRKTDLLIWCICLALILVCIVAQSEFIWDFLVTVILCILIIPMFGIKIFKS